MGAMVEIVHRNRELGMDAMPDKPQTNNEIGGLWLGTGASLLIVALVFHGPPDPDLSVQMQYIAEGHTRWALVHWTAAVALFLLSGAGFLNLTDQNAGGSSTGLRSAWLVLALGALLTVSTAISEAAVVSVAANAGDKAAFNSWWAFGGGMGNGFFALAIATACIALAESRSDASRMPVWSCSAGTVFGILSAVGWSLGEHFGIGIGGPIWLISTLLMCAWLAWFGFAARRPARRSISSPTA
jgi:hypothetical protein